MERLARDVMTPHQFGWGRAGGVLLQNRDDLLGREPGTPNLSSLVASKTTDGAQESSINWREWRGGPQANSLLTTRLTGRKVKTALPVTRLPDLPSFNLSDLVPRRVPSSGHVSLWAQSNVLSLSRHAEASCHSGSNSPADCRASASSASRSCRRVAMEFAVLRSIWSQRDSSS